MGTMEIAECAYMLSDYMKGNRSSESEEEFVPIEKRAHPLNFYKTLGLYNEFTEAEQVKKYLFDGKNMIQIKPSALFKKKAILGKAAAIRKTVSKRLDHSKITMQEILTGKFSGDLEDYIPERSRFGVPDILYYALREIERRDAIEKEYIYRPLVCNFLEYREASDIREVKRAFLRGKVPEVRDNTISFLKMFKLN